MGYCASQPVDSDSTPPNLPKLPACCIAISILHGPRVKMNEYWNYICSLKKRENQNFEAGFFIKIQSILLLFRN